MKTPIQALVLAILTLSFSACKKDDPVVVEPPELITTLTYTLTTDGEPPVVMTFKDIDGDGGNEAEIAGGTITAGLTYRGQIELANESVTPSEDITEEIEEEDEDHQFFFIPDGTDLAITYDDADENGNPIGLATTLTASQSGSANLMIILKHLPVKAAEGVADGDIQNAMGETDIEVTFPVDVQ